MRGLKAIDASAHVKEEQGLRLAGVHAVWIARQGHESRHDSWYHIPCRECGREPLPSGPDFFSTASKLFLRPSSVRACPIPFGVCRSYCSGSEDARSCGSRTSTAATRQEFLQIGGILACLAGVVSGMEVGGRPPGVRAAEVATAGAEESATALQKEVTWL